MEDRQHLESTWDRLQHGWPRSYPIAQFPNAPLLVAYGGLAASAVTDGNANDVARGTFYAGLGVWAYLEVTDGVNAFRRVLGVAGFVLVIAGLAREL